MRILKRDRKIAAVELDFDELLLLNNSLNEVLNGIAETEFHARLGVEIKDANYLLNQVNELIDLMGKVDS